MAENGWEANYKVEAEYEWEAKKGVGGPPNDLHFHLFLSRSSQSFCVVAWGTRLVNWAAYLTTEQLCQCRKGQHIGWQLSSPVTGWLQVKCTWTSCLKPASPPLVQPTYHILHRFCYNLKALPVFCILHVFVNWVSGGIDSPSPMVTSSTKDMEGTLIFGLSKS